MPLKMPKAHMTEDGKFICPVEGCGFMTLYQANYNRHYNSKHKKTPKYICTCGKIAPFPYQLKKHKKRCEGTEALNKALPGNPGVYIRNEEANPPTNEVEFIEADMNEANIRQENAMLKMKLRERDQEILDLRKALEERTQPTTPQVDNGPSLPLLEQTRSGGVEDDQSLPVPGDHTLQPAPQVDNGPPLPLLEETRSVGVEEDQSIPVPGEPAIQMPVQVEQPVYPLEDNMAGARGWLALSSDEEDAPPIPQPRRSGRVPAKEKERKELELVLSTSDPDMLGLVVKDTGDMGRGLFANRVIEAGEWVALYGGELLDPEEAERRTLERGGNTDYDFWFQHGGTRKWYCQDAIPESGQPGRLINHSRKQFNLVAKKIPGMKKLAFKSVKKINMGEQLMYDYNDQRKDIKAANPWLK